MGRVTSFASIALERAPMAVRTAETIGGVTIFGRDALQSGEQHGRDFIQAWRDAMCFEIGGEEFEKLCRMRRWDYCRS